MILEKQLTETVKGPVMQQVHYDPKSSKIEVVHYFNLKPGHDVILSRIDKFVVKFDEVQVPLDEFQKERKRANKRNAGRYVTRFIYHMIEANIKSPHARKFPLRGTSFPLSHLPHHIEVIVD
jgi:hypothetical protein